MTKIKTTTSSASTSAKTNGKIGSLLKHGDTKKKAGRKKTARKIVSKIDAMKPKKPPPAFFYFLQDFRKEYQETNPDIKSMRHIGKACGEKWNMMTYEEKVKYYDIATEKRAEFDTAMVNFTKRKESGEFDEDKLELDDDSDFDG
ncbi:High mobility group B protein 14 [Salvia divinorum]|uniref:High mobility group B protein 14 n=1 Tax=Salvia divinorum TaxID=28513 RepID=A0ABD1HHD9_SALDI